VAVRLRDAISASGIGWRLLLIGLAVRIVLSPLHHTWDSQTWWNAVAQIGAEPNPIHAIQVPFDSARQMTDLASGSNQAPYFEYWAYPPGMLMLWWPLARLWTLTHGIMPQHFAAPDTFTAAAIPPLLSLGLKLPIIAGDLACAVLLAILGGATIGRKYVLNPYVLLACLWTFDPLMLAFLLAGVLMAERGRWGWAGALLGIGGGVKFVPMLLVPVVALQAIRSSERPLRAAMLAVAGAVATFGVMCGPWWRGVADVLAFHGGREGGGMSWQAVWSAVYWLDPLRDLEPIRLSLSPQLGALTLGTALLVTLWLAWLRGLDLLEMSLAIMLAYIAGSKLVNEVYALPAMALAMIVFQRRRQFGGQAISTLLWLLPLCFAAVNVPLWGFVLTPAEALGWISLAAAQQFHDGYVYTYQALAPALTVFGALFQLTCAAAIGVLLFGKRGAPLEVRPAASAALPGLTLRPAGAT